MINKNKKIFRLRRCKKFRLNLRNKNKFNLVVYKTSNHIYAQIIYYKDNKSFVCLSYSTLDKYFKDIKTGNIKAARLVGKIIAKKCLKRNILYVVLDRSGFKYHGRIKELANYARKEGLLF